MPGLTVKNSFVNGQPESNSKTISLHLLVVWTSNFILAACCWSATNNGKSNFFQEMLKQVQHDDPVRAGIVEHAEDYLYSSVRFYYTRKCLIELTAK